MVLTPKYPHMLHGADYNPEQWLDCPDILEKDIELMKKAHINCVSVGIFAWARLEPQEGVYDFDWLEEIITRLYENGIYSILATPSGAKPVWMSEKYPEIRRVSPSLARDGTGERHNHCYTSPLYREKVRAIDTALAERFARHPGVILWHLSNEYGGVCYCPLCAEMFRGWLQRKYGTLENLNKQWWTAFWSHTYTDWEQIHPPVPNGEMHTHGLNLDWKRFTTDQVLDFMKMERDAVKSVAPEIPVTTNFMYDFTQYNYFKFKDELDVISWDAYPQWRGGAADIATAADFALWHDVMRSLKKQPFLLMESTPSVTNWGPVSRLKRPGMHLAASMQAVAHGAGSVQYFQFRKSRGSFEKFHGAVVDHCGHEDTREFRDVEQVGARLQALDGKLYQTEVKPQVALVFDMENRWAIEDAAGPRNAGMHYAETVRAHYRALWERGVPVDIVDEECDISGYKMVVAPMLYMLRAGFEEKLRNFVEEGGTLVMAGPVGLVNENDLCYLGGWPGGGLRDVLGLWLETTDGLWDGEYNRIRTDSGGEYLVAELCCLVHVGTAEVLAAYQEDFYAGEPALTLNPYGKGRAVYLATQPEQRFYGSLYGPLLEDLDIRGAYPGDLPAGVEACLREGGGKEYILVQNFSGKPQCVEVPEGYQVLAGRFDGSGKALALDGYDAGVLEKVL